MRLQEVDPSTGIDGVTVCMVVSMDGKIFGTMKGAMDVDSVVPLAKVNIEMANKLLSFKYDSELVVDKSRMGDS